MGMFRDGFPDTKPAPNESAPSIKPKIQTNENPKSLESLRNPKPIQVFSGYVPECLAYERGSDGYIALGPGCVGGAWANLVMCKCT